MSRCEAKERGKVSRRGGPSIEWYKDGKPQYYCCGYIDKMTDELLPECKECGCHASKAQDDLDKFSMGWNKKLAAEYRESALKIKGRIDELTAQMRAHRGPHGVLDKEGDEILIRRRFLYTMYADTVRTAHQLDHYYD